MGFNSDMGQCFGRTGQVVERSGSDGFCRVEVELASGRTTRDTWPYGAGVCGELRPAGEAPAEWEVRIENLLSRYPQSNRRDVIAALHLHHGHAGNASLEPGRAAPRCGVRGQQRVGLSREQLLPPHGHRENGSPEFRKVDSDGEIVRSSRQGVHIYRNDEGGWRMIGNRNFYQTPPVWGADRSELRQRGAG